MIHHRDTEAQRKPAILCFTLRTSEWQAYVQLQIRLADPAKAKRLESVRRDLTKAILSSAPVTAKDRYPFTAPAVRPRVMKRSSSSPMMMTGTTAIRVSALMNHHSMPRVLFCPAMSTGMVMA